MSVRTRALGEEHMMKLKCVLAFCAPGFIQVQSCCSPANLRHLCLCCCSFFFFLCAAVHFLPFSLAAFQLSIRASLLPSPIRCPSHSPLLSSPAEPFSQSEELNLNDTLRGRGRERKNLCPI